MTEKQLNRITSLFAQNLMLGSQDGAAVLLEVDRLRAQNARLVEALTEIAKFADGCPRSNECSACHAARVLREETKP